MHKLCSPPPARQITWKHMHVMCSDRLFLLKLFLILKIPDTSRLQTTNMIKVQINAYLMTVKSIFKVSFGRSAVGQWSDKNLKWNGTESIHLGSLKRHIKWGIHCTVQTEAAPLTLNFPTTHPIIRFTCDTPCSFCTVTGRTWCISLQSLKPISSLQGREPFLPRSYLFSPNTITSLERWLL
jgi:hypothetical protein